MCCVRIELVTPGLSEGGDFTTVNQPQTLLAGVAEPSENSSRLTADVCEERGSPRWTFDSGQLSYPPPTAAPIVDMSFRPN